MANQKTSPFGFVHDELARMAKLAAPGVYGVGKHTIFIANEARRVPWRNEIASGNLVAPFMIISLDTTNPTGTSSWSASNYTYEFRATFNIVQPRDVDRPFNSHTIEHELMLIHQAYMGSVRLTTKGDAVYNVSNNPLNNELISRGEPYACGSISIDFVAGFSYKTV